MSAIDVAMLWAVRQDSDIPELLVAWDGFSIEENYEGWVTACKTALAAMGDELRGFRYLNLRVSGADLDEEFREFKNLSHDGKLTRLKDPE